MTILGAVLGLALIVGIVAAILVTMVLFAGRTDLHQGRTVLCPILGAVTRVRLGRSPGDGRLSVVWCERFGDAAVRCDRSCLGAAIAESPA